MLELTVGGREGFNEDTEEFVIEGEVVHLQLEHSLFSVSLWEKRFLKPFLESKEKTREETLAYVEAMILNELYPINVTDLFTREHLRKVNEYIDSPSTATTFYDSSPSRRGPPEVITSELIYYWMIAHSIPFECEHWHLNRLFTLIRVCNIKNDPKKKKMSRQEIAARNRDLNAQRKAQLGTSG